MQKTTPKKILFMSQYAGIIGGLENYIYKLSKLLRENGHKTYLLYIEKSFNNEEFFEAFDDAWNISQLDDLKAEDFDVLTLHKISNPENLKILVDKFSPTAFIHDHDYFCPKGYKYFPYKRINCKRAYSRLFCGICSCIVPPRHIKSGLKEILCKNFNTSYNLYNQIIRCPKFVVLSDFMKSELAINGIALDKISVLNPFLEMPKLAEKKQNQVGEILFAGQQVMSKGIPLFLDSLTKLETQYHATILGRGPRLEDFKNMAKEMGLNSSVDFLGFVANPNLYYEKADIMAFTSMWQEPFGLTGIEAMSYECPVVAFNVGGVSQWLKDGYNGFLIKEKDTKAFARAIDILLKDKALRIAMGKNGRKFVEENYTADNFLNKFFEVV